jgi:SAM-dependent methyltransferase
MRASFFYELRSFEEFEAFRREHAVELAAQRAYEVALFGGRKEFTVPGYCVACERVRPLQVDLRWGNGITPSWRERLQCPCGLNNRIRAALDSVDSLTHGISAPRLYATEQVTAFFPQLRRRFPSAVGSEFLRDGTLPGMTNAGGLRHEDLTALTFPDRSFDAVLSFDVLEHVPDYRRALGEMARVLAPGGHLLASFPFNVNQRETAIRATLNSDGSITHLLPPEYHGDSLTGADCLCFQVFGWSVLDDLRSAGFSEARTLVYWSVDSGYLGANQLLIIGRR